MSDLIIKDMEKPKCCDECPLYTCMYNYADCPLIEIPTHGRLIDADAFEKHIKEDWNGYDQWIAAEVENRPTVIEAEEEVDG